MIKIANTTVYGFQEAIHGMRNPMNSWDKSDTKMCKDMECCGDCPNVENCKYDDSMFGSQVCVGPNDLDLMKRLTKSGSDHRKYLRMIVVYCDITAPLFWYKEMDTYKVGTVANSCSTMHKIHSKRFGIDDFSRSHIWSDELEHPKTQLIETEDHPVYLSDTDILIYTIAMLNELRELYLKTKNKLYWYKMIELLPSSYNQKRTMMFSYESLANMYHSRKNHKLDEWHRFCDWVETLPYSEIITGKEN